MWFLIKTSFWFGLVLVLLPFFVGAGPDGRNQGSPIQLSDAMTAAGGVYAYASGMCGEKPEVCDKGGTLLSALGAQARDGALIAFRLLDQHFGSGSQPGPAVAAAKATKPEAASSQVSQPAFSPIADDGSDQNLALSQPLPNFPKPYRPPVTDEEQAVTTAAIPLPTPRPAR